MSNPVGEILIFNTSEEKDWVFIYWYFDHSGNNVWINKRDPIIPAIASLRYFLPNVEIQVVDVSKRECNWGEFPQILNFKLVRKKFFLSGIKTKNKYAGSMALELLSKTEDCYLVAQTSKKENVLVLDADVFWVQPPLPLTGSGKRGFWVSNKVSVNSGLYYYRKSDSQNLLQAWRNLNVLAAYNEQFCHDILTSQNCKMTHIIEERVLEYLLTKTDTDEAQIYSINENFSFGGAPDSTNAKALHFFNSWCRKEDTLSVILMISEIRDIMKSMFTQERYKEIFKEGPKGNVSYKNSRAVYNLFAR